MMKKLFKLLVISCYFNILLFAGNVLQSGIEKYDVTIKKLEVYNLTTATWIILSDTATTVDIASVDAGKSVASMVSKNAAFTFGTYSKARVTIGNNFTIKACTSIPNISCTNNTINVGAITNGQVSSGTNIVATAGTNTNASSSSAISLVIDFSSISLPSTASINGSDVQVEYSFSKELIVNTSSTPPKVRVDFDVNRIFNSATLGSDIDGDLINDNYIGIDFPNVVISIN